MIINTSVWMEGLGSMMTGRGQGYGMSPHNICWFYMVPGHEAGIGVKLAQEA
jgi:hypothetical protein